MGPRRTTAALLAAFMATASAIAEPPKLAELDTNDDGLLSAHEAKNDAEVAKHFELLDRNQDQYLDRHELSRLTDEAEDNPRGD